MAGSSSGPGVHINLGEYARPAVHFLTTSWRCSLVIPQNMRTDIYRLWLDWTWRISAGVNICEVAATREGWQARLMPELLESPQGGSHDMLLSTSHCYQCVPYMNVTWYIQSPDQIKRSWSVSPSTSSSNSEQLISLEPMEQFYTHVF